MLFKPSRYEAQPVCKRQVEHRGERGNPPSIMFLIVSDWYATSSGTSNISLSELRSFTCKARPGVRYVCLRSNQGEPGVAAGANTMGVAASPMLSSQPLCVDALCPAECDRGLHQLGEFLKTWAMGFCQALSLPSASERQCCKTAVELCWAFSSRSASLQQSVYKQWIQCWLFHCVLHIAALKGSREHM